ncbi:MAG: hypothetical protein AAGG68_16820 [Bacteroidota bacterium]
MTLHNFEKYVERKILDRGYDYYAGEMVEEVEQLETGYFSAVVLGSDEYTVNVRLAGNQTIIESECDCPYDWGDTCKHEVAVYYYLKNSKAYQKKLSKAGMDLMIKIDDMTTDELKTCLHHIFKRDREWREAFLRDEI